MIARHACGLAALLLLGLPAAAGAADVDRMATAAIPAESSLPARAEADASAGASVAVTGTMAFSGARVSAEAGVGAGANGAATVPLSHRLAERL